MPTEQEWRDVARWQLAREEACEILSACACSQTRDGLLGDAMSLDHDPWDDPSELALAAWKAVAKAMNVSADPRNRDWDLYELVAAEAEAMLRDSFGRNAGWIPGVEVQL